MDTEQFASSIEYAFRDHETSPVMEVMYISDRDILPDDLQDELIELRGRLTRTYFRIGDIANLAIEQSIQRGLRVTHSRVEKAVGKLVGKTERTVRYYRETAGFYPPEVREVYVDILPFSFFDFARYMGDGWQAVLDYAMENPTISLESLQSRARIGDAIRPEITRNVVLLSSSDDEPERASSDNGAIARFPQITNLSLSQTISGISDLIDKLERLETVQTLPEGVKTRILGIILELREITPQIALCIRSNPC